MPLPAYQDWAQYSAPGSDVAFSDVVSARATYNGPLFDTSAWNHVVVKLQNLDTVVSLTAIVEWHGFQFSPLSLPFEQIVIGPSQTAVLSVPVRGRSCDLTVNVISGVPTQGFQYNVIGVSHRVGKYDAKNSTGSLVSDTRAYLAGAVTTLPMNFWYEGPVEVAIFSDNGNAAWTEFQYYDVGSASFMTFAIANVLSRPNSIPRIVYFPPAPVQAVVNNQGAGQTIAVHLIPAPTDGGG